MVKTQQFILSGAGNKTITGDITYEEDKANLPVIIFVHGFKGFKDWGAHHLVADYFAKAGCRYIKFNFSHNGVTAENPRDVTDLEAFAENTISMELKDVDTVINYAAHTYPQEPIYLIGHSRGGGLVIIKGSEDDRIHKIITWSSISDFSSIWKKEQEQSWLEAGRIYVENARTKEKMPLNKTLLEDYNAHKNEFNIYDAAAKIKIPWLILHGDNDINVNFNEALQLAEVQPEAELHKISGADHVFGASHPYTDSELPKPLQEVCEKTLDFISAQSSFHPL